MWNPFHMISFVAELLLPTTVFNRMNTFEVPTPLWAAVEANKLTVATLLHEGARLRFLHTHLKNAVIPKG